MRRSVHLKFNSEFFDEYKRYCKEFLNISVNARLTQHMRNDLYAMLDEVKKMEEVMERAREFKEDKKDA